MVRINSARILVVGGSSFFPSAVRVSCKFEPLERAVPIQLKNFQSGHPRSALLSVRYYVAQDQTPPPEGQWAECARRRECGRVEPALRPPRKCRAESHLALL